MARNSLNLKSIKSGPKACAMSSLMRIEEDLLRSEKDKRLKDGHGATFLENSDLEGLHRLKLNETLLSDEQQCGFHGFGESFMVMVGNG
ncbi:hypothetical protein HanIR_Chr17g0850811 [Helianthus annuus]|nr:hypothetical protein HanIR_Chr17g0850811 [Helianthus annuus]